MKYMKELETYLEELESYLRGLPLSERAEIITELKSHILEKVARDPEKPLATVLQEFGSAKEVASSYLDEQEGSSEAPPKEEVRQEKAESQPFGGENAFDQLFCMRGRNLKILGGLIEIEADKVKLGDFFEADGREGKVRVGQQTWDMGRTARDLGVHFDHHRATGKVAFAPGEGKTIEIRFAVGKLTVKTAESDAPEISWEWRGTPAVTMVPVTDLDNKVQVDLYPMVPGKATLTVPRGYPIRVTGATGKVRVVEPLADTEVSLATGRIELEPAPGKAYRYDLQVMVGETPETPKPVEGEGAGEVIQLKADVKFGKILVIG